MNFRGFVTQIRQLWAISKIPPNAGRGRIFWLYLNWSPNCTGPPCRPMEIFPGKRLGRAHAGPGLSGLCRRVF